MEQTTLSQTPYQVYNKLGLENNNMKLYFRNGFLFCFYNAEVV